MLLLPPLQRADWDRIEQSMLHEESENTTKGTRQGISPSQGPEPGGKKKYYYNNRKTVSTQTGGGGRDQS